MRFILKRLFFLREWQFKLYVFYKIKMHNCKITLGNNILFKSKAIYSFSKFSILILGNNVIFNSHTRYNFVGIFKPSSIAVLKYATLQIGNNVGFSGVSLYASKRIEIGNYCQFGGNVCIWDTDFHPLDYYSRRIHNENDIKSKPIIIGNDVFVGANSIILKGTSIGDRSIIAAGSVVTKNIPADEVWGGNPIKFIRKND